LNFGFQNEIKKIPLSAFAKRGIFYARIILYFGYTKLSKMAWVKNNSQLEMGN